MRVLVACEESGVVRDAFLARGHDAWSCDILPTASPGPHLEADVLGVLDRGWDLMIAHHPCTHLAVSGAQHFHRKQQEQAEALGFVRALLSAPILRIALENPVSVISSRVRKPDQIVQPWWFGDPFTKTTGLWLKGLPLLQPTDIAEKGARHVTKGGNSRPAWYNLPPSPDRARIRSRTFPGFARAMAAQWGCPLDCPARRERLGSTGRMPTDLPNQSPLLTTLPHEQVERLQLLVSRDLFFFAEAMMGYEDLVERFHRPVCDFLDHNDSRFKLVMLARSSFKSSLCTIARTARDALIHPNRRFLMLNEVEGRAEEWLVTIRTVYEENALLRALYSDVIPKQSKDADHWSSQKLTLNRTVNVPTATIRAAGMTTSLTGDHYTDITVDDPISEKAREEPSTMEKAIGRISKVTSFFADPRHDRFTLIGTPWAKHDVIAHFRRNYGKKMATYFMPAVLNDELTFPERLTWEVLRQAQIDLGDLQYGAQYLLVPRDAQTSDFLPVDLREWVWADRQETIVALLNADRQITREINLETLDVTITVDLAIAEHDQADRTAIVVCGTTDDGIVIVLDTWAERATPHGVMDAIFSKYIQWGARVVGLESIAYQKALKYFLRAESEQRGIYLPVRDLPAMGKKLTRIRGLQPIAAAGRLYLNARQQMLRQELLDFPDPSSHDDVADALAMHLPLFQGVLSERHVREDAMSTAEILRKIRGYGTSTLAESDDREDDLDWDVPFMSCPAPRNVA